MHRKKILLNADIGESSILSGKYADHEIVKYIDIANISCGSHASDPESIRHTIKVAKAEGVHISAHPSYPDRENFGRKSIAFSEAQLLETILKQLESFRTLANLEGAEIKFVKPHGALYLDMMENDKIFITMLNAISTFNDNLSMLALSTIDNQRYIELADQFNIKLLFESFLDRNYTNQGLLLPRSEDDAVINNPEEIIGRMKTILSKGVIHSIDGKELNYQIDTLCLHGDNPAILDALKELR